MSPRGWQTNHNYTILLLFLSLWELDWRPRKANARVVPSKVKEVDARTMALALLALSMALFVYFVS